MRKIVLLFTVCLIFIQTGFSKGNEPILVGSYNIRYENTYDGINSWVNRKEHVKALIQFHDWDIFGIQEGVINQVRGIAELQQYAWLGKGRDDGKEAGEHCAVYYRKDRFKMLATGNFWLSETPEVPTIGWDSRLNKRICSWARFKDLKTKKEFYFFSVHFDNLGAVARVESGKLMVKKIAEIAKDMPVICVGDFNSGPESEQIKMMQTNLNDVRKISETPPYGPEGTSSGFKTEVPVRGRIDYIFVSKKINVLKYGALTDSYDLKYPSDHLPIMSKIVIN